MMNKSRGISQRKNGNYEAYFTVRNNGNRPQSNKNYIKIYVGTYPTKEEAITARTSYIRSLI